MTRASLAFSLLLLCSTTAHAAKLQLFKSGDLALTFTERSPESNPVKITQRTGWPLNTIKKQADINYDLSTESSSLRPQSV